MTRVLFFILLCLAGCAVARSAQVTVTLQWNRNPEPEVAGYNVYQGSASRAYDLMRNIGTNISTVLPVTQPVTFYAVTAYDATGLESGFSDEVRYEAPFSGTVTLAVPRLVTVTNTEPVVPPAPVAAQPGVMFTVEFRESIGQPVKNRLSVFVPDGGDWFATATATATNATPKSYARLATVPRGMPPMPGSVQKPKRLPQTAGAKKGKL